MSLPKRCGCGDVLLCCLVWTDLRRGVATIRSPWSYDSCVVPSWAMRTLVGLPCPNPLRKVLSGRLIALKGVGAAIHSRSPPAPTPLRFLFFFSFHPLEITQPCMYNILPLPLRRSFIDIIAEAFGHWQSVAGLLGGKESWSFSDVIHHKKGNAITACAERYVN